MFLFNQYKYYVFAVALVASFFSGVKVSGWFHDSKELATQERVREFKKHENSVATKLEERLKELKANERIIEREKLKIIDRPIYLNECIDDDGLQLLNKQRSRQDANTGKPSN
ncbi:MAG: hypothetical protein DDT42_02037 [candidate division WS2 bacterium]|uniref:Uncharacterized protein n=1 Tax=Psychracetigena formicireducens TaxID=2986056 RepID=A0A9E2BKD6_PSYF1|nr:hypothetical protein [Candidatus Psychracetigena formicireducens]